MTIVGLHWKHVPSRDMPPPPPPPQHPWACLGRHFDMVLTAAAVNTPPPLVWGWFIT